MPPVSRLPLIEMLRGMAAMAVVFHHISQQLVGDALANSSLGRLMLWLGGWGVFVFFVLSGFCIHASTLKASATDCLSVDWESYAIRRARRILPGYFAALALSIVAGSIAHSALISQPSVLDALTHLTFTSCFSQSTALTINCVLWTVVVEVQFYLIYPLFIWCRNRIGILPLTMALLALSLSIKLGGRLWLTPESRWTWHHMFLNLWWTWSLGAVLAEIHASLVPAQGFRALLQSPLISGGLVVGSLAIGMIDGASWHDGWLVIESYALPLLAAGVVSVAVFSPWKDFHSRPAEALGTMSYSLYLFHPLALWTVWNGLSATAFEVKVGAMIGLSLVFAWLGYQVIERPFMRSNSKIQEQRSVSA